MTLRSVLAICLLASLAVAEGVIDARKCTVCRVMAVSDLLHALARALATRRPI